MQQLSNIRPAIESRLTAWKKGEKHKTVRQENMNLAGLFVLTITACDAFLFHSIQVYQSTF